ncbi:hypothetical protein [Hansschlegelia sp. KR7-227]|uniref:hypothetical protein n=1 Tax=Hansschlegelia sp. KR7-227 TaxID=3400914 RepID=UPI003C110599
MRAILALTLCLFAGPSPAAEGGCESFAWPIETDAALLAAAARVDSGAVIDVTAPTGVRVLMVDAGAAGYVIPPSKPPAPGAPGGVLRFEALAGVYQITVSDRVWLEVVQDGVLLEPMAHSGAPDCDGARKSMRFDLVGGPATLQFSGSPSRTVAVAITRSPKDAPK